MINLSNENKALCFEDSTPKPLYIFLYYWQEDETKENGGYWKYFKTIDKEDIVLESMEIDEGILDGKNFKLGSYIAHYMKVQWRNDGFSYKNMLAVPVQQIGSDCMSYFDGVITEEEISKDGSVVSVTLSSFISEKLDIDVLPTLKEYTGTTFPIMIYNALNELGIDLKTDWTEHFVNADNYIFFDEENLPKTLPLSKLLNQIGEFLGCHIIVQEKRWATAIEDMQEDMEAYQPSGRLTLDFKRLSNVDVVAQSEMKPLLPSGYKRIPYLECNGKQYIDLKFVPTKAPRIKMTAKVTNFDNVVLIGTDERAFNLWNLKLQTNQETNSRSFSYNYNTAYNNEISIDNIGSILNKKCVYDISNYLKIDDITYVTFLSSTENFGFSDENTDPVYLFGANEEYYASALLYDCQVYNGKDLVRDLVPVVNLYGDRGLEIGLYDFVTGDFFKSETIMGFFGGNAIEAYTLPYYIDLTFDKTNRISIDQITVETKSGTLLVDWWSNAVKTSYSIKENIFFDALAKQSLSLAQAAVDDVGRYLAEQNFYQCDLKTVYPAFIDGGDYLVVKGKNQSKLPVGYSSLEYIEIKKETAPYITGIITNVMPHSNNIEIDIDFSFNSNESVIFEADAKDVNETILMLYQYQGALTCYIGNWYIGGAEAFQIPYAPKNQKLNLKIRCGNGRYEYNGTFSGNGTYNGDDVIHTKTNDIMLGTSYGRNTDFELYHFAYSQNGIKLCDMYPCMRESDGAVGMYDIVQNKFRVVEGNPNPNYESAEIVVPVLSSNSKGINSMKADVSSKATNVTSTNNA